MTKIISDIIPKVLCTLLFICVNIPLKAEYNNYLLKLEITLNNSDILNCYADIGEYQINPDSINLPDYLMKMLPATMSQSTDSIQVYKDVFFYPFMREFADTSIADSILVKDNLNKFRCSEVNKIKLLDYQIYSYLEGVATELHATDSIWFRTKPVTSFSVGGYLCSHLIFIHEMNPETDNWMKELIRLDEILGKRFNSVETDPFDKDVYDEEIGKLLMKLKNKKVVIVSECTC